MEVSRLATLSHLCPLRRSRDWFSVQSGLFDLFGHAGYRFFDCASAEDQTRCLRKGLAVVYVPTTRVSSQSPTQAHVFELDSASQHRLRRVLRASVLCQGWEAALSLYVLTKSPRWTSNQPCSSRLRLQSLLPISKKASRLSRALLPRFTHEIVDEVAALRSPRVAQRGSR